MQDKDSREKQLIMEPKALRPGVEELNRLREEHQQTGLTAKGSEELSKIVLNSTSDAICLINVDDFKIVTANRGFLKQLGLTKEEEAISRFCYEITHHLCRPCTGPDDVCPLSATLTSGTHSTAEHMHYGTDGKKIYVEVSISPVVDENGKITQIVHVSRDITERKRMEEALREGERRFRDLANLLPQSVWELNEKGIFTFANRQGFQSHGYTLEEITEPLNALQLFIPEDRDRVTEDIQRVLHGGELGSVEYTALRKDGSTFPVLIYAAPITRGGRTVGLRGITIDITERKQAEEARKESEKRYRELADSLPQTVFETDEQGNIVFINRQGLQTFGVTSEDIDKNPDTLRAYIPEDRARVSENIQRVLNGEEVGGIEYTLTRKDGSTFPAIIYAAPIIHQGKLTGSRGVTIDITERKRMEEQLRFSDAAFRSIQESVVATDTGYTITHWNEVSERIYGIKASEAIGKNLSDVIEIVEASVSEPAERIKQLESQGYYQDEQLHRTKCTEVWVNVSVQAIESNGKRHGWVALATDTTELRKAREQLQHSQLLASLGEMTAGIAHEVNNPLGSILLYSELLMKSSIPTQARKDLRVVHNEARRATRIMTDLLTYGRRVKPQMRRLSLHGILRKVSTMRRYRQKVQNITVSTNLLDRPLYVRGDSPQLTQVFMNLMLNAEEALRESNGGNIVITTQIDGQWARVSIADDGVGIPQENLSQVFYPFFSTKEVGEGAGLGLSICYGIVTSHNGLIRAENNETGGATFTVELPLAEDSRARKLSSRNQRQRR